MGEKDSREDQGIGLINAEHVGSQEWKAFITNPLSHPAACEWLWEFLEPQIIFSIELKQRNLTKALLNHMLEEEKEDSFEGGSHSS